MASENITQNNIKVIETLDISPDEFKNNRAWMGISTSKKTYPDEFVADVIRWGSDNFEHFYILVADMIQNYNKVPFSNKGVDKVYDGEYIKPALKRRETLQELVGDLPNVDIKLMHYEMMRELEYASEHNSFMINYGAQLFDHKRFDGVCGEVSEFDEDIKDVTKLMASHLLERADAEGISHPYSLFQFSCYTHEEVFISTMLAALNVANVKVGPVWEKNYDQITKKIADGHYGTFIADDIKFHGVYLDSDKAL